MTTQQTAPDTPPATAPTNTPRPPAALAARARDIAAEYHLKNEATEISDGAYAGNLVDELTGKLVQLATELDRYQAAAVDPATALLTPCRPPDVANGVTDCHPGEAWPCSQTRAAWAVRGWNADEHVEAAARRWRFRMGTATTNGVPQ